MKKFFISAFLVVSLFAVSIVPSYAVVGVDDAAIAGLIIEATVSIKNDFIRWRDGKISSSEFQKQLDIYKSYWGTPSATSSTCTISYEALCELCTDLNQSQSCRLYYNSTLGGYVIRAQSAYTCYYKGSREVIWDNTYKTLCNSAGQFYVSPYNTDSLLNQIQLNTDQIEGYIDQIEGRLARTVGSSVYTVADSCYLLLDELRSMIPYIDQIEGRLARTVNGTTYTVADSSYHAWQQLVSMSDTLDRTAGRLLKTTSDGTKYTEAELTYNIWSRMNDLISAVNNQHITLDTSNIRVNVDGSSINLWNTKAYCCGYRDDSSGAAYQTLAIPFDSALDIIARLNTDYVSQSVTVLNRDGSTSSKYVRSATLLDDGAIRVWLTNGYTYYLCDNTNVIYVADLSGSPDYLITSAVDTLGAKLDTINESVMAIDLNVEVIQDVQQYDDDVDNGVDALSKILDLVREFFNPGAETNWRGAKDYAMHWGSDVE